MMVVSSSKMKINGVLTSEIHPYANVMKLLRQILAHINEEIPEENNDQQEVVLEVEMDGVYYTLTRSLPPLSQLQVNLSPREQEIVRLVAKGFPNKAIADVLDISQWTVATHIRRVFTKLDVCSRAEMVARVLEDGLLVIDPHEFKQNAPEE